MKVITLDARRWTDIAAFYADLLAALEAPEWHGTGLDALFDSMIGGDINGLEPPYRIEIDGASSMPREVEAHVALVAWIMASHTAWEAGQPAVSIVPKRR
ncbi:MAG: barstar family protein [Proteobacteria bacterium]|nr:barstar family protein [Pseudomonadota bacterium]